MPLVLFAHSVARRFARTALLADTSLGSSPHMRKDAMLVLLSLAGSVGYVIAVPAPPAPAEAHGLSPHYDRPCADDGPTDLCAGLSDANLSTSW